MQGRQTLRSDLSGCPDRLRDGPLPNLHGATLLYCLHRGVPRIAILGSDALLARETLMAGLDIGGYEQRPDWPKMGPSLLIAACLVLAIRTAKWPPAPEAPPQTVSWRMRLKTQFIWLAVS